MHWPVHTRPVADTDVPLWHVYYLGACRAPSDPTMIWGTDVDVEGLEAYLREMNRQSPTLVSPAHLLLRAVGCALKRHPELNRRVIGTRVYEYRQINLMMPVFDRRSAQSRNVVIERADERPLVDIAAEMWRLQQLILREPERSALRRRLEPAIRAFSRRMIPLFLWSTNNIRQPAPGASASEQSAALHVNYFATRNLAPLRMYKASRFPAESCLTNVTMGSPEPKPVVVDDRIVIGNVAPLFIRSDHRIVDMMQLSAFVATLRGFLTQPATMERELPAPAPRAGEGPATSRAA
jgi:hypothetical protein